MIEKLTCEYLESLDKKTYTKSALFVKKNVLKHFVIYLLEKKIVNLNSINDGLIKDYFLYLSDKKKYGKNTIRKYRSQLRLFFGYLVQKGMIKKNLLPLKKDGFLTQYIKKYAKILKKNRVKKQFIHSKHTSFNNFNLYLKEKNITEIKEINHDLVNEYYSWVRERKFSKNVLRHYKYYLKEFFEYLVEKGEIEENPFIKKKEVSFFSVYVDDYIDSLSKRGYRMGAVKSAYFSLNSFIIFLKEEKIESLDEIDITVLNKFYRWLKKRKLKDNTVCNKRNDVKRFFLYLGKKGEIPFTPFLKKEKPEIPYDFKKYLNDYMRGIEFEDPYINFNKESRIIRYIKMFYGFIVELGKIHHSEIRKEDLKNFVKHLSDMLDKVGKPIYKCVSINRILGDLKPYIRWLSKKGILAGGFSGHILYLRQSYQIKRNILTRKDLVALFSIKVKSLYGFMMKTIFILQYASGLRIGELLSIKYNDIDFNNYTLKIFETKTKKERVVQVGEVGAKYLKIFIDEVRPKVCYDANKENRIFLSSCEGKSLSQNTVNGNLKKFCKQVGINKQVSTHCFRHSYGTHLLENGLGIKAVADLLGHKDLSTTERYTRLNPERLRKTINNYHPMEKED